MKAIRLCTGLILLSLAPSVVIAQDSFYRFEAGPILSAAFVHEIRHRVAAGVGGRVTANLTSWFGGEFEITHFPRSVDGRRMDSTLGLGRFKLTLRRESTAKLNVFGIAGYGFRRDVFTPEGCCGPYFDTEAGVNLGGGVEIVPKRRMAIRFDFTDFMPNPDWASDHFPDFTISAMFRF